MALFHRSMIRVYKETSIIYIILIKQVPSIHPYTNSQSIKFDLEYYIYLVLPPGRKV